VARLLGSCPDAKLLVTSRSPLHLRGEHEFQVASLDVPDHHQGLGIKEVEPFAAVQLFVERARAVRADFALTTTNAAPVAAICQGLDGIPLAIELAAALVKALPVQTLAERLSDQPRLLTRRDPTAPPRQQTLQATFDWSHNLLAGPERILFRRLAVFAGGFSLEAAEVVAAGDGIEGSDILPLLVQLVDKSLLVLQEQRGIPRYRLLEPLRQYGWERLVEAGEAEVVGRRHAAYYGALAEEAEPSLEGPDQAVWLDRLEREHNNVRAALRWSGDVGDVELGLRLGGALWLFWFDRGHLSEGRDWLSHLLAGAGMSRTAARAKALKAAGMLAHYQGDDTAETRLLAESLAIRCELGDRLAPADMLVFQGDMAYRQGELARARSLFEEGLGLNRALGNEQGVAEVLAALSGLAWDQGDYALARSLREESVSVNRKLGDQAGIAWMLLELGRIVLQQDDLPSAHACFRESLLVARAMEFPWGILHTLEGLAEVAIREGKMERAAYLSGAAAAIRNGMHLWDVPGGRVRSGRQLGPGRHHVDAETAAAAWAEGQAMTLEQAIAYALEEDGPSFRG
jgi:non-specific serine/threonine protein kinase